MNRTEKAQNVESLKEKFMKANGAFLTEYRGMNVEKLYDLRKKIKSSGHGELQVVKNRLAKLALKGTPYESIADQFKGPIAVALSYKDIVAVAKAVSESISETSPFKIKMGNLEGKSIDANGVKALAKLPSKETLLAMMLCGLKAPVQNFASVLAAVPRDFVNVITAVKDAKEKSTEKSTEKTA